MTEAILRGNVVLIENVEEGTGLGLTILPPSPTQDKQSKRRGIRIRGIVPGTPAASATEKGLEAGNVILSVGDESVLDSSYDEVVMAIHKARQSGDVRLVVCSPEQIDTKDPATNFIVQEDTSNNLQKTWDPSNTAPRDEILENITTNSQPESDDDVCDGGANSTCSSLKLTWDRGDGVWENDNISTISIPANRSLIEGSTPYRRQRNEIDFSNIDSWLPDWATEDDE
eukprot:m.73057 g.73057  ORF g.73057 m.73057 type:complete len:228 (+) comp12383_c0_seq1:351-1034(+)